LGLTLAHDIAAGLSDGHFLDMRRAFNKFAYRVHWQKDAIAILDIIATH
jgi:hypothetical protein